jgi:hypothetical protein
MDNGRVPLTSRVLVRLAACFVPREDRAGWLQHWRSELRSCWVLIHERPELSLTPRMELLRFAASSFPDAWLKRRERNGSRWARTSHGPAFPLLAIAFAVLLVGLLSGGFSGLRTFLFPPPYANPGQLVTLWQDFGALGRRIGIPAATLREWDSKTTLMGGFAAYYQRRVPLSRPLMKTETVRESRVTADIFTVLGVKALAGRGFEPLDAYSGGQKAVLSYGLWRDVFDGDPGIVGQSVTLDGQPATIIGVMPQGFWFPNKLTQLWRLFPLYPDTPPRTPYLLSAVARLKPDATPAGVRAELRRLAAGVHIHWNGSMVEMTSLRNGPIRSLQVFFWAIPLAMCFGALAARLVIGRQPWRYWAHFAVKTGAVFTGLSLLWIELTGPSTVVVSGWADPGFAWLSMWWFLTASILLVWWAIRDQKRRCPVCCSRLVMPVTIGTYSSPMLEPVRTELICERGHGILYVPGGLSTDKAEWRPLDSSWEELFR